MKTKDYYTGVAVAKILGDSSSMQYHNSVLFRYLDASNKEERDKIRAAFAAIEEQRFFLDSFDGLDDEYERAPDNESYINNFHLRKNL